eukprot:scaffold8214_cov121-Isochrysis_galbana.AAC.16
MQLVAQNLGQASKVLLPPKLSRLCSIGLPAILLFLAVAAPAVAAVIRSGAVPRRCCGGAGRVIQNDEALLALLGQGGLARALLACGPAEQLACGGPVVLLMVAEQVADAEELALLAPVVQNAVEVTRRVSLVQGHVLLRPLIDLPRTPGMGENSQNRQPARRDSLVLEARRGVGLS